MAIKLIFALISNFWRLTQKVIFHLYMAKENKNEKPYHTDFLQQKNKFKLNKFILIFAFLELWSKRIFVKGWDTFFEICTWQRSSLLKLWKPVHPKREFLRGRNTQASQVRPHRSSCLSHSIWPRGSWTYCLWICVHYTMYTLQHKLYSTHMLMASEIHALHFVTTDQKFWTYSADMPCIQRCTAIHILELNGFVCIFNRFISILQF